MSDISDRIAMHDMLGDMIESNFGDIVARFSAHTTEEDIAAYREKLTAEFLNGIELKKVSALLTSLSSYFTFARRRLLERPKPSEN